jgi:hypothetical protein
MTSINLVDGYSLCTSGDSGDIDQIINTPEYIELTNKLKNKDYILNCDYKYTPSTEMYGTPDEKVCFFIGIDFLGNNSLEKGDVITIPYPDARFGDYMHEEKYMIELRGILETYFKNKILVERGLIINKWGT